MLFWKIILCILHRSRVQVGFAIQSSSIRWWLRSMVPGETASGETQNAKGVSRLFLLSVIDCIFYIKLIKDISSHSHQICKFAPKFFSWQVAAKMTMTSNKRRKTEAAKEDSVMLNKRRKIEAPKAKEDAVVAIPDDVMMEIFLLLPPKSVLRFRAVCRAWAAMLSSDEFIQLRAATYPAAAPPRFLLFTPKAVEHSAGVYCCSPGSPPELLLTIDDVRGDSLLPTTRPCLGLTLLYDVLSRSYYVCNPATRAITRLPPFPGADLSSAGLGFDACAKEHRVVRLFHTEQQMQCEVYNVGASGEGWRPTAAGVPFRLCRAAFSALQHAEATKMPPVLANARLHWLLGHQSVLERPRAAILSFSITDETFQLVKPPSFVVAGEHVVQLGPNDRADGRFPVIYTNGLPAVALPMHLVELDGHLCLVRDLRSFSPAGSMLEIWMLHDYSSGIWSLHFCIDVSGHAAKSLLDPRVVRVLGSVGNSSSGKKIVIGTCRNTVHAYDPARDVVETLLSVDPGTTSEEFHRINAKRNSEEDCPLQLSLYEESLAPLFRTREEIALSSPRAKAAKEILLRLPARSITRFKLVCKQWRSLIENESFIHSHLMFSNPYMGPKILLVGKGSGSSWFNFQRAASRGTELDRRIICSKPCHGLNIISSETEDYLCNPCTGFQMALSNYLISELVLDDQSTNGRRPDNSFSIGDKHIGLGFNQSTQRHVVVKIINRMMGPGYIKLECWYWDGSTLKWGKTTQRPPMPVNDMPPAYLDGILYWISEPRLQCEDLRWQWNYPTWLCKYAVVYFDIAAKEFGVFGGPSFFPEWSRERSCNAFAVELAGRLCVVHADPATEQMQVWKLNHDGWRRAYSICLAACKAGSCLRQARPSL